LIKKGLITRAEFVQKISEERATYQKPLNLTIERMSRNALVRAVVYQAGLISDFKHSGDENLNVTFMARFAVLALALVANSVCFRFSTISPVAWVVCGCVDPPSI
jgi:hypothetical protein